MTFLGVSFAKLLIFSLTTEIPRSSDALSSSTRVRNASGLFRERGRHRRELDHLSRAHPSAWVAADRIADVPEHLSCESEDGGRLSRSWWAVEEHVGELADVDGGEGGNQRGELACLE